MSAYMMDTRELEQIGRFVDNYAQPGPFRDGGLFVYRKGARITRTTSMVSAQRSCWRARIVARSITGTAKSCTFRRST